MTSMFLFRYRDLVADTLREHRAVLAAKGACLWGWWKRPTEDSRQDVWAALRAATESAPIRVGLFDSGAEKVFEASVIGVVPPDDHGHPPVPEDQEDLVPSYYRDSPFSFGWLKLGEIAERELDFFGKYSLAERPVLPNYPVEFLDQLVGNVIVEASELRGMDTTIWKVRPKLEGDREERIITSPRYIVEPISAQPVAAPGSVILHITDPHFATGPHRRQHVWRLESETSGARQSKHTLSDAITRALSPSVLRGRRIGIVLVTGDVTYKGDSSEFDEARRSITKLLGQLDLSQDNIVVLPGNHDIQWSRADEYKPEAPVELASERATANFRAFYKATFRHESHVTLACGRRYALPNGVCVEIAALNSSSLETGKNFLAGVGRVQEECYSAAADGLGWSTTPTLALRILALHHHLALTEDLEPFDQYGSGFGIAVDAPRIQRLAARDRVQLAIHGHKHRAFVWRSDVYKLPENAEETYDLGALNIIGGGSAGSPEVENKSNYFNLIEVQPTAVTLELFRSKEQGQFEKIQTWNAALTNLAGAGLQMSKWSIAS